MPSDRAAYLTLATILIVGAAAASLSPLTTRYAPLAWGVVTLGAAIGLLLRLRWGEYRLPVALGGPQLALGLAALSHIAAATAQALAAAGLPSPHLALHDIPGSSHLYLLLAALLACSTLLLALRWPGVGLRWAALLGAALFSSTLYLVSFAVLEAGPVYASVFAFTLIALSTSDLGPAAHSSFAFWGLAFLAAFALAAAFSPVPGPSLEAWLRLSSLVGLSILLSLCVDTSRVYKFAAWGIVIIAGIVPVFLGLVKWLGLLALFGFWSALAYQFDVPELGGANLVARSTLCVLPLAMALTSHSSKSGVRWLGWGVLAGGTSLILYARSWEGLFACLVALGSYGLMGYSHHVTRWWKKSGGHPAQRWTLAAGAVALLLAGAIGSLYVAPLLNVYSFNGRLIHWRSAALAWADHPWLGGGPNNELIYIPYAGQPLEFQRDTQITFDDPLGAIQLRAGHPLRVHAHNLLLEMGAGTGIVGFVGLAGILVVIFRACLRVWRQSNGSMRRRVAGCFGGIAGALAWGMLDVLWVTPPFFSFPVWGLVGLLLAMDRGQWRAGGTASAVGRKQQAAIRGQRIKTRANQWLPVALATAVAVGIVLLPALAFTRYAAGFVAFQEQRWDDALSDLGWAASYRPLDAHPRQLLAEAYLGQGDMVRAAVAYERASALKPGFSPYDSQLGWLAWLRQDVGQATRYFEQAIAHDPGEIRRSGLHADVGLAYAAQGRYAEAIAMFTKTLESSPQMAGAPYWRAIQRPAGHFDVVLDPVYVLGPSSELDKRILSHLAVANVTDRQCSREHPAESPISLNDVLDVIEADYQLARANDDRSAPLLLAALAEAARAAGLYGRAERAYLDFQARYSDSAYGYRDLGMLYHNLGRLDEAQTMLERAVEVSPRDIGSRFHLALVYLDCEMWSKAEQTLRVITVQSQRTLFRSRLFDPDILAMWTRLYRGRGDLVSAISAQRRVAIVRGAPADYLALADLHRQLGQPGQAGEQCLSAAEALLHTWPRPLAPELWKTGLCLAQATEDTPTASVAHLARRHPAAGNVLLGHVHRARGHLDQAVTAYQRAAEARPDEGAAHYFLGETYLALGQPQSAEAAYRRAARLDPWESLPLLALGRMQWSQGRQDAAVESFRAAVQVTPGWDEAQVALGNVLLVLGDREGAASHYGLARTASGSVSEGLVYDLAAHLAEAGVDSPNPQYVRRDVFTIDGDRRQVLFQHPDARVIYTIDLVEKGLLSFDIAVHPEAWQQPGDGVSFAVYVQAGQEVQRVFDAYIDPKHNEADRRWHSCTVDLDAYLGQRVTLILETGSGPAGDDRYDWAGWGAPRLLSPWED